MPHAEPPRHPLDASGTNDEESGVPDFFPPAGNFNAVVPLSEIDTDAEPHVTAPAPSPTAASPVVRAAAEEREHEESEQDEQEEVTLVPARAARTVTPLRPAARRPSWPVMIAALALSLGAGLAAGVYLIKSGTPVETQAPASVTEAAAHDAPAASDASDSRPTQVASESRPEARPQADTNEVRPQAETDAAASDVDTEVSAEKTSRGLPAPKRVTAAVAERTPERPARKAPALTADAPTPPQAVRARRASSAAERTPFSRAPERSLPVSSPPPSAKSKRVIQWP